MSDASKKVIEDIAKPHELKKTAGPPAESLSSTQAKVLLAVTKKQDLTHVEAPKAGLSEAEKAAYLEEKKAAEKK